MFKAMGTVAAACGIYFVVGAAMTAGCLLGGAAAEKLIEMFDK